MGLVFDEYLYQSDLTDNYNKNNKKIIIIIIGIMAAPEAVLELQSVYHIC
jgi:hypothetical protein